MTPTVIRYYHIRQNEEKRGHYIQPQSKKDHPKTKKMKKLPNQDPSNRHQPKQVGFHIQAP